MIGIGPQRRQKIFLATAELVEDFLDDEVAAGRARIPVDAFFARPKKGPSPSDSLVRLFNYVHEFRVGTPDNAFAYMNVEHPNHPCPLSWLMRYRSPETHEEFAVIAIDPKRMRASNPVFANEARLANFVFLHEVGHIFLHYDQLFSRDQVLHADFATPEQEAEAWCFAIAFVMLCAEENAIRFCRHHSPHQRKQHAIDVEDPVPPHVWQMLANLRI